MPNFVPAEGKLKSTVGRQTVRYKDSKGRTYNALVLGEGTDSGKKLSVYIGPARVTVDNVPLDTTGRAKSSYSYRR